MNTFPIIHMTVPWDYVRRDAYFDVRTLCDADPWDDGHSCVKYGMEANCVECMEIYNILKSDWKEA